VAKGVVLSRQSAESPTADPQLFELFVLCFCVFVNSLIKYSCVNVKV
jgi:hypothetical protein